MKKIHYILFLLVVISWGGCAITNFATRTKQAHRDLLDPNTFRLSKVATETTYGYSSQNPIKVGGYESNTGILNERRFLNALRGPNGEQIQYEILGSCCYYKTSRGAISPVGALDQYMVKMGNQKFIIFLNSFETGELKAPKGFSFLRK